MVVDDEGDRDSAERIEPDRPSLWSIVVVVGICGWALVGGKTASSITEPSQPESVEMMGAERPHPTKSDEMDVQVWRKRTGFGIASGCVWIVLAGLLVVRGLAIHESSKDNDVWLVLTPAIAGCVMAFFVVDPEVRKLLREHVAAPWVLATLAQELMPAGVFGIKEISDIVVAALTFYAALGVVISVLYLVSKFVSWFEKKAFPSQ